MKHLAIVESWQRRPKQDWRFPLLSIPPLLLISTPFGASGTCLKPRYPNYSLRPPI
ncbi:hypothetical protein FFLO_02257 [Filobasidium floriforme]|uniref:Uncharacterized protein n=1 Tax=Filobasidium floriforme TaxID=5210 RepID=A0A8K0JNA1_9TREE|nr:hypothetical protein FFLO_02257 [Filobasidium floriforme]